MKIAIGCDHGGFELKEEIVAHLEKSGHAVKDFGTYTKTSCDYPKVGYKVASGVAAKRFERGILICKSGLGMSMVANKVPGVRAALLFTDAAARSSREHNDANVAVFAGSTVTKRSARKMIKTWLETGFEGGRHARRVRQMNAIEKRVKR